MAPNTGLCVGKHITVTGISTIFLMTPRHRVINGNFRELRDLTVGAGGGEAPGRSRNPSSGIRPSAKLAVWSWANYLAFLSLGSLTYKIKCETRWSLSHLLVLRSFVCRVVLLFSVCVYWSGKGLKEKDCRFVTLYVIKTPQRCAIQYGGHRPCICSHYKLEMWLVWFSRI